MSSPRICSGVRVAQSIVLCGVVFFFLHFNTANLSLNINQSWYRYRLILTTKTNSQQVLAHDELIWFCHVEWVWYSPNTIYLWPVLGGVFHSYLPFRRDIDFSNKIHMTTITKTDTLFSKDDYVLEFKTFCQTGTICISRVVTIKVVPFSKNIILLIPTLSLMDSNQIWRCLEPHYKSGVNSCAPDGCAIQVFLMIYNFI
jgi:hypothetical protein